MRVSLQDSFKLVRQPLSTEVRDNSGHFSNKISNRTAMGHSQVKHKKGDNRMGDEKHV